MITLCLCFLLFLEEIFIGTSLRRCRAGLFHSLKEKCNSFIFLHIKRCFVLPYVHTTSYTNIFLSSSGTIGFYPSHLWHIPCTDLVISHGYVLSFNVLVTLYCFFIFLGQNSIKVSQKRKTAEIGNRQRRTLKKERTIKWSFRERTIRWSFRERRNGVDDVEFL